MHSRRRGHDGLSQRSGHGRGGGCRRFELRNMRPFGSVSVRARELLARFAVLLDGPLAILFAARRAIRIEILALASIAASAPASTPPPPMLAVAAALSRLFLPGLMPLLWRGRKTGLRAFTLRVLEIVFARLT